ncbi:MAG: GIY-YIG nuclease family protein [Elusimicrobiales bacterium]|nr:GIY-YIG nuclease family protein [Elusimicrobiales bacterium]
MINLSNIPSLPGVYIIKDKFGKIIYVGKSKNLKKRVRSYYSKNSADEYKIKNIKLFAFKIEFIICDSERESLVLERKLISIHNPIFNTMWKDSKTYPYVLITSEVFPRIIITRKKNISGNYYGPYPYLELVKKIVYKLRDIGFINLRRCNYEFSIKKPLDIKKRERCIYYHTFQCCAPCDEKRISKLEYNKIVSRVKKFFSLKHSSLIKEFEKRMKEYSQNLEFEKAKEYRDFIDAINHIYERVTVDEAKLEDIEKKYNLTSVLITLKEKLNLKKVPYHIESFDVSNIMNKYICGVCVCFINGVKNHYHYRKFKSRFIPNKFGGNDYAVMYEIVKRRFANEKDLPDLIIIDGGKGQLEVARKAVYDCGLKNIDIISIAKGNESIYTLNSEEVILLEPDSKELLFLISIRDETHRFAVNYHKKLRESHFIL